MPRWRTLSSDGSDNDPGEPAPGHPRDVRAGARWRFVALSGAGGLALGAAAMLLVWLLLGAAPPSEPVPLGDALDAFGDVSAAQPQAASELVVDVAGAVMQPGLHRLVPGDRVGDAIAAAGGFGPRVDLAEASQSLNLAQPLEDGVKILVPELGISDVTATGSSDGRIDINHASADELESLPGIGPVTAGKIIEAREVARFDAVRELRTRGVVGQSVFDDIRERIHAGH